jgi:hypothetical protein
MRCGGRSGRSTAVAATASGGATMAPSAIAAAQGRLGTRACATTATAGRRENHRNDHQADKRRPVVAQVSLGSVVAGVDQNRRHEQGQHQVGRQGQTRRSGNEGKQRAADRQEHGIGSTRAPRSRGEPDGGHEDEQNLFEFLHRESMAALPEQRKATTPARRLRCLGSSPASSRRWTSASCRPRARCCARGALLEFRAADAGARLPKA